MTRSAEPGPGRARRAAVWVVPLALAAVAGSLAWRHRDALLGAGLSDLAAGPATQVQAALARKDRAELELAGGGRVELSPVRFGDVAVQAEGDQAQVIAVVEARGAVRWGDQRAELGYVGREAFAMARCPDARWCARGALLPELEGVLAALRARADAAGPEVRVRAWQIRVERGRATAGEDYDLRVAGGVERRRSLHTLERAGDRWVFVGGT